MADLNVNGEEYLLTNPSSIRRLVAKERDTYSARYATMCADDAAKLASSYETDARIYASFNPTKAKDAERKGKAVRTSEGIFRRLATKLAKEEAKADKECAAKAEADRIAYENDPKTIAAKAAAREWVRGRMG